MDQQSSLENSEEEFYTTAKESAYVSNEETDEDDAKEENPLVPPTKSIVLKDGITATTAASSLSLARRWLYLSHFGNQFSELTWQFSLVIWLAQLTRYESLILVSTYGVTLQAMVCLASPILGRRIDQMARRGQRLQLATRLIATENICVIAATLCCAHLLLLESTLSSNDAYVSVNNGTDTEADTATTISSNRHPLIYWEHHHPTRTLIWLILIHILGAIAQVLDRSFLVAVERDWIVIMSQQQQETKNSDESWLSTTNVTLKQIDLSCQVLAPAISGWVLELFESVTTGVLWVGAWNCLALFIEWVAMNRIAQLVPALKEPTTSTTSVATDQQAGEEAAMAQEERSISSSVGDAIATNCGSGWKGCQVYLRQSMALAGLGLALLYFNVLTFSGMMTAYLVSRGMSLSTIGMWRGASSTIGLLGTCVYHQSAKHFSLPFTALWSIVWEFLCLTLTFASIFSKEQDLALVLLIGGVLPSRIGLWVYDIAVTQLFQQSVTESVRGQVGGTQNSLNALMELLPFLLAIFYHKPSQFYVLIAGGYLAVGLAMLLYVLGVYLPYYRRRFLEKKESLEGFELVPTTI